MVEYTQPGRLILSRLNRLYSAGTLSSTPSLMGQVPLPFWREVSRFRLAQRLLRCFFTNVIPLPEGSWFVTFDRRVGIIHEGEFHPLPGLRRPCRVLRGGCCLARDGALYFGEYLSNPTRGPMSIYRYRVGSSQIEIVYTFPTRTIRHVHGIYSDPFGGGLWCTVGDRGSECRILRTDDGFHTVDTLGMGDETWRAVSLGFTEKAVYYGSDAEFQTNFLYAIDRSSQERKVLAELNGPAYYTYTLEKDLFLGVTAELCPSNPGRSAMLWHFSEEAGEASAIFSARKDFFHRKIFMVGTLCFHGGSTQNGGFFFHTIALSGCDNRVYSVQPAS